MQAKLEYAARNIETLTEIARAFECDLVTASDKQLLLDIDDPDMNFELWRLLHQRELELINEKWGVDGFREWTSRGGQGIHIVVTLKQPVGYMVACVLEAALGSDPIRQIIASTEQRAVSDTRSLFKPKEGK